MKPEEPTREELLRMVEQLKQALNRALDENLKLRASR